MEDKMEPLHYVLGCIHFLPNAPPKGDGSGAKLVTAAPFPFACLAGREAGSINRFERLPPRRPVALIRARPGHLLKPLAFKGEPFT